MRLRASVNGGIKKSNHPTKDTLFGVMEPCVRDMFKLTLLFCSIAFGMIAVYIVPVCFIVSVVIGLCLCPLYVSEANSIKVHGSGVKTVQAASGPLLAPTGFNFNNNTRIMLHQRFLRKSQILSDASSNEQHSSKSALDVLKEISHRRVHVQLDENEDDAIKRPWGGRRTNHLGPWFRHSTSSGSHQSYASEKERSLLTKVRQAVRPIRSGKHKLTTVRP
ncbi:uncharacterized protein LOC111863483 [Cryptotermes secundus]|uniref:uncharacterized protein LOC111863483 n=1 Tax=Cryptotermes secundus TaxID=105785 RepID=UPI000CD7BF5F|nr:uncharacterized protein LOC111863483 [Cryptotermes secundus]